MKQAKSEVGQVLILVLLLLLVGGLLLPPLLSLSMTGLATGRIYETKADEMYSADSGLEHALWQIKYGELEPFLATSDPSGVPYDIYDFNTEWSYTLPESLNGKNTTVSLENVWIPLNVAVPNKDVARNIIESGKLIVTSNVSGALTCKINIVFYPDVGEALDIEKLGVWLSPGFQYVAGSSSFGQPSTQPHAGGQALIWDFGSTPFVDFPGVDPGASELRSTITFQFTASQGNTAPSTVSWVTTSGVLGVSYSWDADTHVYHITSIAGNTKVEGYNVKNEIRKLGSAISGDYRAIGNSLMLDQYSDHGGPRRDTLLAESSSDVSDISSSATVEAAYLYWSGWFGGDEEEVIAQIIWEDDCSNSSNWAGFGPDWGISYGRFRGHHNGGESDRYLTLGISLDLSGYSGDTVSVNWEQDEDGYLEDTDGLYFSFSGDGGSTWSSNIEAFRDDSPLPDFSCDIPAEYVTNDFKFRFYVYGLDGYGEYCYVDNIYIAVVNSMFMDTCNNFNYWDEGDDWTIYSGRFRGHHDYGNSGSDRYLTMTDSIDLSSYGSGEVGVAWNQEEYGSLEYDDRLYFSFSGDGGSTWSSDIEAFRDDNPPELFMYTVPDEYLTDNFKMRLYLYGFSGSGEYCYLDNILVYKRSTTRADTRVVFKIDGTQVYFDGGTPQQGIGDIVADKSQVIDIEYYGQPHGYSYACFKDVTELVRDFATQGGNGTYTVGGVDGDTGDEWSFAGWSLIIIYSSPETEGHQLYLYDKFLYCGSYENLDFDGDGQPGGTISGFYVPQPITGEANAATMTCFVTEGDDYYNGDYIALNGTKLWDGTEGESLNDVWNDQSIGMSADGVDVDTFYITWASGLLQPGDTSAQIDISTDIDIWNLVYIILSFRSEITTSDAISYSID